MRDTAAAVLVDVLVLVDDTEAWETFVALAFPYAEDPATLTRYLRWAPVHIKREWAAAGVQVVLQRSDRAFLALSGAAFAAAGPRAHPVWDALATAGPEADENPARGD